MCSSDLIDKVIIIRRLEINIRLELIQLFGNIVAGNFHWRRITVIHLLPLVLFLYSMHQTVPLVKQTQVPQPASFSGWGTAFTILFYTPITISLVWNPAFSLQYCVVSQARCTLQGLGTGAYRSVRTSSASNSGCLLT